MDISSLYLRYNWTVNLALLALLAILSASTTNRILSARMTPSAPAPAVKVSAAPAPAERYNPSVSAILSRDIFKAAENSPGPVLADGDTAEAKETDLRLQLLGVVFSGDGHPWNIATIKNMTKQETGVFLKGDRVHEDAVIHQIRVDRVLLARSDGTLEELRLVEERKRGKRARPGAASQPRKGPRPTPRQELDLSEKIREVAENQYEIEEEAIRDALSNLNSIVTQARVIPNFEGHGADRKVSGFRIYRIQPKSIFQFLGLRNGDVIKSINGQEMDSVEKGLSLLQSLRDERRFNLVIERNRAPVEMSYEVR